MRFLHAANTRLGRRLGWAGLLVALVGLQGCASIVSGTSQSVSVDTPGCAGARCELSNDKGKHAGHGDGQPLVQQPAGHLHT